MSRAGISLPLLLLAAALPGLAQAKATSEPVEGGARYRVTFTHQPVIACKSVSVAGSFNGWSETKTPMRDPDGDGVFTASVLLPRGQHQYKFVVNGSVWHHDADNQRTSPDGHSGFNSVLDLGASEAAAPGRVGDGAIDSSQAIHDPDDLAFACAVDGRRRLVLRVHVLHDDVERVSVVASPRPVGSTRVRGGGRVEAVRIATYKGRDVYEARITYEKAVGRVRYGFQLEDGAEQANVPSGRDRFAVSTNHLGRFKTPDWVRDAVFYQIFPDRFRDGDSEAKPKLPSRPEGTPWHVDDKYLDEWGTKPSHFNFMGGDLPGITEQADYLARLGVTALYLNPIFKAGSNHRYDAADFDTIDPALGTLEDFHDLRDAMHERGMKILLDCVFNHTGDTHYAFQDAMKKGPKSKYWSWYFFDGGFPVVQTPKPNYRAWWGFGSLPQLNTKNPEVIRHLMGVATRWLVEGGDGWRLDVPNEVDEVNPEFWPDYRRRVKRQDPDAYLVGEIWTDARSWLQGDKFDAVMNYPVRSAALEFAAKGGIDAQAFWDQLSRQLATYPEPALRVQFNLLGSHDTARIKTIAGGDARRVRLAMTFLFAWPGAPVIYYGDEVGLSGGKDPGCRGAFPWDPAEHDTVTLEHVTRLGKTRADERTLRRGSVRHLLSKGQVCAFARIPEQGEAGRPVLCVLNAASFSERVEVPLGGLTGAPTVLVGGGEATRSGDVLVLELKPYEGVLVALGD